MNIMKTDNYIEGYNAAKQKYEDKYFWIEHQFCLLLQVITLIGGPILFTNIFKRLNFFDNNFFRVAIAIAISFGLTKLVKTICGIIYISIVYNKLDKYTDEHQDEFNEHLKAIKAGNKEEAKEPTFIDNYNNAAEKYKEKYFWIKHGLGLICAGFTLIGGTIFFTKNLDKLPYYFYNVKLFRLFDYFTFRVVIAIVISTALMLLVINLFEKKYNTLVDKELEKYKKEHIKEYEDLQKQLDIEEEEKKIEYQKLVDEAYLEYGEYKQKRQLSDGRYIGLRNNSLVFFEFGEVIKYHRYETYISNNLGAITEYQKFKLSDIFYFDEKGSLSYSTNVSGGGSDIGGAVIGGILAGGAGAVVGSRKEITSETVEHDTRKTVLKTKHGEYEYPYEYYNALCYVIPEKEYKTQQISKKK